MWNWKHQVFKFLSLLGFFSIICFILFDSGIKKCFKVVTREVCKAQFSFKCLKNENVCTRLNDKENLKDVSILCSLAQSLMSVSETSVEAWVAMGYSSLHSPSQAKSKTVRAIYCAQKASIFIVLVSLFGFLLYIFACPSTNKTSFVFLKCFALQLQYKDKFDMRYMFLFFFIPGLLIRPTLCDSSHIERNWPTWYEKGTLHTYFLIF